MTPAEIAENSGHLRLAQTLRGYMVSKKFDEKYFSPRTLYHLTKIYQKLFSANE